MSHKIRDGEFNPENSDGCTIISKPYNWLTGKQLPFRHCCIEHDRAYWYGGTKQQRRDADRTLQTCVASYGGFCVPWSWVMWIAVRIFGSPRSPFVRYRWARRVTILEAMMKGYRAGQDKD